MCDDATEDNNENEEVNISHDDINEDCDNDSESSNHSNPYHPYPDELFFLLHCYTKNPQRPELF